MLKAKSLATKYKLHGGKRIEETLFVVCREMLFNSIKCSLLYLVAKHLSIACGLLSYKS